MKFKVRESFKLQVDHYPKDEQLFTVFTIRDTNRLLGMSQRSLNKKMFSSKCKEQTNFSFSCAEFYLLTNCSFIVQVEKRIAYTRYNVPELEVSPSSLISKFEQNAELNFFAFCLNAGTCILQK